MRSDNNNNKQSSHHDFGMSTSRETLSQESCASCCTWIHLNASNVVGESSSSSCGSTAALPLQVSSYPYAAACVLCDVLNEDGDDSSFWKPPQLLPRAQPVGPSLSAASTTQVWGPLRVQRWTTPSTPKQKTPPTKKKKSAAPASTSSNNTTNNNNLNDGKHSRGVWIGSTDVAASRWSYDSDGTACVVEQIEPKHETNGDNDTTTNNKNTNNKNKQTSASALRRTLHRLQHVRKLHAQLHSSFRDSLWSPLQASAVVVVHHHNNNNNADSNSDDNDDPHRIVTTTTTTTTEIVCDEYLIVGPRVPATTLALLPQAPNYDEP